MYKKILDIFSLLIVILYSVFAQNILFNANSLNNLKKPLPQKISTDI